MNLFPSSLQVVGYASLSPKRRLSSAGYDRLCDFATATAGQMEIFAEEYHPSVRVRPLFNEVRKLIVRRQVQVLVIPSLFHVTGGDKERKARFLALLQYHNVRLLILEA